MKMDVTDLSFHELEDLVARIDRLCATSCLQTREGRLELMVY